MQSLDGQRDRALRLRAARLGRRTPGRRLPNEGATGDAARQVSAKGRLFSRARRWRRQQSRLRRSCSRRGRDQRRHERRGPLDSLEEARLPFGLFRFVVDERRTLLGGAVSNAGNLRAWCRRELRLPNDERTLEELIRRPAAAPLTVLPFWVNERAPSWPEHLDGVILGLTQATTAADLLRATALAVSCRLADIFDPARRSDRAREKDRRLRRNPGFPRLASNSGRGARAKFGNLRGPGSVASRRRRARARKSWGKSSPAQTGKIAGSIRPEPKKRARARTEERSAPAGT